MNSTTEEKELVWLPKSIAKKIEQLGNPDNFVHQYIEDSKRDIRANFETFDDEILGYKANMIRFKAEFKKAADECLATNYQIWEDFEKKRAELRIKVEVATNDLRPLTVEFEKLVGLIRTVDGWQIERFLETLEKVKGHLYGEERNILEFLLANYRKPEKKD